MPAPAPFTGTPEPPHRHCHLPESRPGPGLNLLIAPLHPLRGPGDPLHVPVGLQDDGLGEGKRLAVRGVSGRRGRTRRLCCCRFVPGDGFRLPRDGGCTCCCKGCCNHCCNEIGGGDCAYIGGDFWNGGIFGEIDPGGRGSFATCSGAQGLV